jgi:hypothetical protein
VTTPSPPGDHIPSGGVGASSRLLFLAPTLIAGLATAEYAFGQIRKEWDELDETNVRMSSLDRLRAEYRTLFKYTVAFPKFRRFMRQECSTNNPRLKWVAKTAVLPLIDRLFPQIVEL